MTQAEIIKNYLQEASDWVVGYSLHGLHTKWGYIGASGTRTLRKLAEEGKILRQVKGKYVYYKIKQKQKNLW